MSYSDFHIHTVYCDGKNTPEEMVLSAIEKGLSTLGFSVHSYLPFDERYCIALDKIGNYIAEINALKEKYKDKIDILCGIEMDYFSSHSTEGFDYVIGSVHFVKVGEEFFAIDLEPCEVKALIKKHYGGDVYSFCEDYYSLVEDVAKKTKPDIIGHFDLISKFNENGELFDDKNPRYISAWQKAMDTLLEFDIPFEVNTGAISRGYRTTPYPSPDMLRYILENGGRVLLSSDSHNKDTIGFQFEKWEKYLQDIGFSL